MKLAKLTQSIVVASEAFESAESYSIIESNISILNHCLSKHIYPEEVSQECFKSYYVDYYLAQVENGGFSQFVYNSNWNQQIIKTIMQGLKDIKATKHLKLFKKSANILNKFSKKQLEAYFESDYFGDNSERDTLNAFNDEFYSLSEKESLIELNSRWLKNHPAILALPGASLEKELNEAIAEITDMPERQEKATKAEPRYLKLMKALCLKAGKIFSHPTAGDANHKHEGETVFAMHFLTDEDQFYMLDFEDHAIMFSDDHKEVTRLIDCASIQ